MNLVESPFETAVVTGASGLIGARLVERLNESGVDVVAVGRNRADAPARVRWQFADIRNKEQCADALASLGRVHGDIVVFHLAAESDIAFAKESPASTIETNVVGTANLLEACHHSGIKRFVLASTSLVYGGSGPQSEASPTSATSTYAATKLAAESLVRAYSVEKRFACEVVRLANCYGPRSGANRVVGRLLRQVVAQEPIRLATLRPKRDFIFVDDVVEAFVRLARIGDSPGHRTTNLGSGIHVTIRVLVETALRVARASLPVTETDELGLGVDGPQLSINLLRERTGWSPAVSLEAGIRNCLAVLGPQANIARFHG